MVAIETNKGEVYELTLEAVMRLKAARDARAAEAVFNEYADHVPRRARCDVWFGCD